MNDLSIRKYHSADSALLHQLMFNTIHTINSRDYSNEQISAWANEDLSEEYWIAIFDKIKPYVALKNGKIAGFADIQSTGFIEMFYCSTRYIGQGVGAGLMQYIFSESKVMKIKTVTSHVSITAKPFFERFGFSVVRPQLVFLRGECLKNYVMQKDLTKMFASSTIQ